jgi:hypothetical protein
MEWTIKIILELIETGAIIFATSASIYAINTWKREGLWKKKSEVAEEVLYNCYDINNKIREIRTPISFSTEGKTRQQNSQENVREKEIRDWAYVPIERLNKRREAFLNLEKLKLRCKIFFAPEVIFNIDQILSLQNDIVNASRRFARLSIEYDKLTLMQLQGYENQERINYLLHHIADAEAMLSENYLEEDKVNLVIHNSISNLEKILQREIAGK